MRPRHARPRAGLALAVLAAHLALLLWWLQADRLRRSAPASTPRVAVRLIAPRAPLLPRVEPAVPAPREAAPLQRPRAARASALPPAEAQAREPLAITAAPLPAEPGASQPTPEPAPSLMDGEATRRAIRASAREPGLAAQAGRQGPALQTPDERLGERVQKSAKGDCLKGEYVGGGMGLLSLPFLAAAALGDQCRR